jgi:two-component sensor histidine kinase
MPSTRQAADPQSLPGGPSSLPLLDAITRRNSIRGILLLILLVALLPIMALSTWQGVVRLQRDRSAERQQLLDAAEMIARSEHNVIAGVRGVLTILAAVPDVRSRDQTRCGPVLARAVQQFPAYSHFSITRADGALACASNPRAVGMQATDPVLWKRLLAGEFLITVPVWGLLSERPVLRAMLPITRNGAFDGAMIASIDLLWLRKLLVLPYVRDDVAIALVDGAGRPVARSHSLPWARLPLPASGSGALSNTVFTMAAPSGRRWSYAVAPLNIAFDGGGPLYIVYAAAQPARFGVAWWLAAGYFVMPLLALLLAATAIWFGANRAILRWVSLLGELARQIGSGEGPALRQRPSFADAPSEVRDLAAELLRMSNTISDREQRLRGSVAAQSSVARELHHRVRNNLQVMGSFLSLQAEELAASTARHALEEAQLRIATMAMVNGLLYADGEVTTVAMARLLDPIADLLSRHTGVEGEVVVDQSLAPRHVDIDQAMPLALWIVEATVCLFERADPAKAPTLFTIRIINEDDLMCIVVSAHDLLPDMEHDSLHRRLVRAIAHQLGAKARIDDRGPSDGKIVLCLPHDPLIETV